MGSERADAYKNSHCKKKKIAQAYKTVYLREKNHTRLIIVSFANHHTTPGWRQRSNQAMQHKPSAASDSDFPHEFTTLVYKRTEPAWFP